MIPLLSFDVDAAVASIIAKCHANARKYNVPDIVGACYFEAKDGRHYIATWNSEGCQLYELMLMAPPSGWYQWS